MTDYSVQNKKAWEYNAYAFWVKQSGTPSERAKKDLENPLGMLKDMRIILIHTRISGWQTSAVPVGKRLFRWRF